MSVSLTKNFFQMLMFFRRQDLATFCDEHDRLYKEAQRTGDFVPVTEHYYSVMSTIVNEYFSGNFHFVAPLSPAAEESEKTDATDAEICEEGEDTNNRDGEELIKKLNVQSSERTGPAMDDESGGDVKNAEDGEDKTLIDQMDTKKPTNQNPAKCLEESLKVLHGRIGKALRLCVGSKCVDIGCGIGTVMMDLAPTGAQLTGLTVAQADVDFGNEMFRRAGIHVNCRLMRSACERHMPLADGSQDAAYAIYALKYFPVLGPVMAETARVLRRGGRFIVYDLMKTNQYDPDNVFHRELLGGLAYACGMPAMHTRHEYLACAEDMGLQLVDAVDFDAEVGLPFYYCFSSSPAFMWLINSPFVDALIRIGEALCIFPRGFHSFNKTFLAGTVAQIVASGRAGILHGGEMLVFEKVID